MEKKILIIGPITDIGGREIEAGYFAESLIKKECQLFLNIKK